jgi:hypothetical protein
MSSPLPIRDLAVIGYTGHLPELMRPGYVAAVFEDRDSRIWLAPYELHENYLSDASCIDRTQFDEFTANDTAHKIDPYDARPGHVLWQDLDGSLRYQPSAQAEQELRSVHLRKIKLAGEHLRANRVPEALTAARVAFAASPRIEAYAMLALCYERDGVQDLAKEYRNLATAAGHNIETFDSLLEDYRKAHAASAQPVKNVKKRHPISEIFRDFVWGSSETQLSSVSPGPEFA